MDAMIGFIATVIMIAGLVYAVRWVVRRFKKPAAKYSTSGSDIVVWTVRIVTGLAVAALAIRFFDFVVGALLLLACGWVISKLPKPKEREFIVIEVKSKSTLAKLNDLFK